MNGFDYVLAGGGLQSGLIALALRARQPTARIALIERETRLGGNHTWCFHQSDVPAGAHDWINPLIVHRWSGYRVVFPRQQRRIDEAYSCVRSERLDQVVSSALGKHPGSTLMLGCEVTSLSSDRVRMANGDQMSGKVVIDARGPQPPGATLREGYQKFLGLELMLKRAHGLECPILMDATVDQSAGYRFCYVLPMDERTVLVEDTYITNSPAMNRDELRAEIQGYAARQGWDVEGIRREETGVLPMPWAGNLEAPTAGPLVAGYRGGWFHPGTGYSFPVAARLAEFVAGRPPDALFGPALVQFAREHRLQAGFAQFLNRLQFQWYAPHARRAIYERFYRLPDSTIRNFYALRLRWRDRFRLVFGVPPRGLSLRYRLRSEAR